jgi:hypothetical protein
MASYLSNATLTLTRTQENLDLPYEKERNLASHRAQWLYGTFGGISFEYKVPRGFLVLDIRCNVGLNNIVLNKNRCDDSELFSSGLYLDNDFYVDYLSVGLGYHFSIYQSKKSRY